MSRGIFGWDLPPGCTMRDIDEQAGVYAHCEVCGEFVDNCICPECPVCTEAGRRECYDEHGMRLTHEQVLLHDWNSALLEYENWCENQLYEKELKQMG